MSGNSEIKLQNDGRVEELSTNSDCADNVNVEGKEAVKSIARHVKKNDSNVERRSSLRLQKSYKSKKDESTSSGKRSSNNPFEKAHKKIARVHHLVEDNKVEPNSDRENVVIGEGGSGLVVDQVEGGNGSGKTVTEINEGNWLGNSSSTNDVDGNAEVRVKETLRIFNTYYLQYVQEQKRCSKTDPNDSKATEGSKSKKGAARKDDVKHTAKRPDLKAISKMMQAKEILYPRKFGRLPGIHVGHQFFSRAEMVALGLHSHWLYGIGFVGKSAAKKEEFHGCTFPLALSVVLSGQYEDDVDNSEDVIYTGQGGNDLVGNKHQVRDQVLSRGNLALKNNMEQSVPVRVIRGHKSDNSYTGKVYTYDGLYKVIDYWDEKGVSKFKVFKYKLRRMEGQPTLTTNQVLFTKKHGWKASNELPGLVCEDICQGQEEVCIPATNLFDDPPVAPDFKYLKHIEIPNNVNPPADALGCKCEGKCTDPAICSCAQLNGSKFPYVSKNGGRLIEAQDVVYECGPKCGCGPDCVNRTSQRGIKYRLEVFRTPNKGWAVRSWDSIPSGAPVGEYTGMLKRNDDLDNVSENDYIFDIDCWHTIKEIGGRERRLRDVSAHLSSQIEEVDGVVSESSPEPDFCIDAGSSGNVARFINHSCEPNLFVQCVLSSHHDVRLARVVLIAADNIPPLQELTYDYGYGLDSVIDADGKIKQLPCYCGAANCRKRLY